MTPEEKARKNIDHLLELAGWCVQDLKEYDPNQSLGVAVREFPLSTGEADYALFVDRKAVGVINAICKGNSKMMHDALIAATAKINADYLVTDDDTLRKRIIRELPSLTLLTNEEFHQIVSSYSE
jgi:type I restriction enzyme R subunit